MAAQTFNTNVQGYWRDLNKSDIPNHSGVYFVYEAWYNPQNDKIDLYRLIYIGESEDVGDRLQDHEKYNEWVRLLSSGRELCFSTCPIADDYRVRVEAAYIFEHKPIVNTEYKNAFPFDQTTIVSSGNAALLASRFTVYRT